VCAARTDLCPTMALTICVIVKKDTVLKEEKVPGEAVK
jgi:hypothetical protein